jgi:hypothetical protein
MTSGKQDYNTTEKTTAMSFHIRRKRNSNKTLTYIMQYIFSLMYA